MHISPNENFNSGIFHFSLNFWTKGVGGDCSPYGRSAPTPFFYANRSFSLIACRCALLKAKINHFAPQTLLFCATLLPCMVL